MNPVDLKLIKATVMCFLKVAGVHKVVCYQDSGGVSWCPLMSHTQERSPNGFWFPEHLIKVFC